MWKYGEPCYHGGYVVTFNCQEIMPKVRELSGVEVNKKNLTLVTLKGSIHRCAHDHVLNFIVAAHIGDGRDAFERGVGHIESVRTLQRDGSKMIWESKESKK